MMPSEFWACTPWELGCFLDGRNDAQSWWMETLAWLQANILSAWTDKGKRIRPDQLYRKPGSAPRFSSKEEYREYMRKKSQQLEDQG